MYAILALISSAIVAVISSLGYAGVVLAMALESACIPLPSEVIMPFAGFLASQGRFSLAGVSLAGAVGCTLGSAGAYAVGAWGGRPFIERYGRYLLIRREDLDRADRWFARYGQGATFASRLLPVIRTFISLPAGIARMPFLPFLVYAFLGSLPWSFALAYAGFLLGERWEAVGAVLHKIDWAIVLALVAGAAWFLWHHWPARRVELERE